MDRVGDVMLAFDRHADDYDRWFDSPPGQALFRSEVAAVRLLMNDIKHPCLEIGVGSGRFAEALGIEYGIDPSPSLLRKAKERGIDVMEGVGEHLPYADGMFGGVFLLFTLCFVDDPVVVINEAKRVLKPTGMLIIGFINRDSTWGLLYSKKKAEGHPIYRHATFYTPEEITVMLNVAQLDVRGTASTLLGAPSNDPQEEAAFMGLRKRAGFICILALKK